MRTFVVAALVLSTLSGGLPAVENLPQKRETSCGLELPKLVQAPTLAELSQASRVEKAALREKYLGKNGFLRSKLYRRAVELNFPHQYQMTPKFSPEVAHFGPAKAADQLVSYLVDSYDDAFLRQSQTPEEARVALQTLADRLKATRMKEAEYVRACRTVAEFTNTPEKREELRRFITETIPLHGAIIQYRGALGKSLVEALNEETVPNIFVLAGGAGGILGHIVASAPLMGIGIGLAVPGTLLGVPFLAWVAAQKVHQAYLKAKLHAQLHPRQKIDLEALEQKDGEWKALMADPTDLIPWSPDARYLPDPEAFRSLPSDPQLLSEGKIGTFGDEILNKFSEFAQAMFQRQSYAKDKALWRELDSTLTSLLKKQKKWGALKHGEATAALHRPIADLIVTFQPVIEDLQALRGDAEILEAKLTESRRNAAHYLEAEMEKIPAGQVSQNSQRERKFGELSGRLELLDRSAGSLQLLMLTLDQTEDYLLGSKSALQNIQQNVIAQTMLRGGGKKAGNLASQLKALKKYIDSIPDLEKTRAR